MQKRNMILVLTLLVSILLLPSALAISTNVEWLTSNSVSYGENIQFRVAITTPSDPITILIETRDNQGALLHTYYDGEYDEELFVADFWMTKEHYKKSGTHNLIVQAVDADGDSTKDQLLFTIAEAFPEFTKTISPIIFNEDTSDSSLDLHDHFTDPDGDELVFGIQASGPSNIAVDIAQDGTVTFTPDDDWYGTRTVRFTAADKDDAGDTSGSAVSNLVSITVTNVNDAPDITSTPGTSVNEGDTYTYSVSGSDIDNSQNELSYSLVSKPSGMTINGNIISYTPSFTSSGAKNVQVRVQDGSGGQDQQSFTLNVQDVNRDPVISSLLSDPALIFPGETDVTFTVDASDDSDETLTYHFDFNNDNVFEETSSSNQITKKLSKGQHIVNAKVTDNKDGESDSLFTVVLGVNNDPMIDSFSPDTDFKMDEGESQLFTITSSDIDPADTITATWTLDGEVVSTDGDATTSGYTYSPDFLAAGDHTLTVVITDGTTAEDSVSWNIEVEDVNQAPTLNPIGSKSTDENKLLSFMISGSDVDSDNTLTYSTSSLPTGANFNPSTRTFSWTPGYSDAGTYSVTFTVTDNKGASDSETVTVSVEDKNRVPAFDSVSSKTVAEQDTLSFTVNAEDPDTDNTLSYSVKNLPSGADFNSGTRTFAWTPGYFDAGSYTVTFEVTDGKGGSDELDVAITVTDTNRAPTLNTIGDKEVDEGETLSFAVSGSDADSDNTLTFQTSSLPEGASFDASTREFSWTPDFDTSDEYAITFTVQDNHGAVDSELILVTVNDMNRAPVVDSIADQITIENEEYTYQVEAYDPDFDSLSYSVSLLDGSSLKSGMSISSSGLISWTPDFEDTGDYTVTVTVSDGRGGESSTSYKLTVRDQNRAPSIDPIGTINGAENSEVSFTVTGSDPDGDTVSFSASGLPSGADFDEITGVFIWTPGFEDEGTYTVTFTATDGFATSTGVDATIVVADTNRDPVFVSSPLLFARENVLYNSQLKGTDPDGDSFTFSLVDGPDGMTVLPNGEISWTPGFGDTGSHDSVFRIEDTRGGSSEGMYTIFVVNENRAPVFDDVDDKEVHENSELTFSVSATDADGNDLVYSAVSLPEGASFDASTREFSWTPDFEDAGGHEATFKVVDVDSVPLEDTLTVSISVIDVNRPPRMISAPVTIAVENTLYEYIAIAEDPDGDDLRYSLQVKPDSENEMTITDNVIEWTPTHEDEGIHDVILIVDDLREGGRIFQSYKIEVRDENRAAVLEHIPDQVVDEGDLVSFTAVAVDPDGDVLSYHIHEDAPEGAVMDKDTGEFTWQTAFGDAGEYSFHVSVNDGHLGDFQVVNVIVNEVNRDPVLDDIADQSVNEGELVSVIASGRDSDGDAITYSVTNNPSGSSIDAQTGAFTWQTDFGDQGTYTDVRVTVTDSHGASASKEFDIFVGDVNRPPVIDSVVPSGNTVTIVEGDSQGFSVSARDPDGDSLTYNWLLDGTSVGQGSSYTFTTDLDDVGIYTLVVVVSDGQFEVRHTWTITVLESNEAPVIQAPSQVSVNEGELLSFVVSGSDPNGDAFTLSASNVPGGASFDTASGQFAWTPGFDSAGVYTVTFAISDGQLQASTSTVITVLNSNRAPVFTSSPVTSGEEDTAYQYDSHAVDADGDVVTYSLIQGPEGMIINTGTGVISWLPDFDDAGSYGIIIEASDVHGGSSRQEFTLVVANVDRGPVFITSPVTRVEVPDTYTYNSEAVDPDGDTVTYRLARGPQGMTIGSQSGLVEWKPNPSDKGDHIVIIEAIAGGDMTEQRYTLTVSAVENFFRTDLLDFEQINILGALDSYEEGEFVPIELTVANYGNVDASNVPVRLAFYDGGLNLESYPRTVNLDVDSNSRVRRRIAVPAPNHIYPNTEYYIRVISTNANTRGATFGPIELR